MPDLSFCLGLEVVKVLVSVTTNSFTLADAGVLPASARVKELKK
jgi:hypothetical protein